MPIFELGYRHWEGTLQPALIRWFVITRVGIRLAFQSKLLRRFLFVAWAPLMYYGFIFFGLAAVTEPGGLQSFWGGVAKALLGPELTNTLATDPSSVRAAAWSIMFRIFFASTQAGLTMLVVAIVGPPLIARDVRSKAFLVYFSKPITRWEYVAGKASVVFFFIFMVTLFPGLVVYLLSIAFSPSVGALIDTFFVAFKVGLCSLVIAIPCTAIVLFFSSITTDHRYASVGWIALCLIGIAIYQILASLPGLHGSDWISMTSIYHSIGNLNDAILDVAGSLKGIEISPQLDQALQSARPAHSPMMSLIFLGSVTVLCLWGMMRRISAPMRI